MRDTITTAIQQALGTLGATDVTFVVEHPTDLTHGDYATNAAMAAAKQLGQSPREVAAQLTPLVTAAVPAVARVEVAGPGFVNVHLHRDFFVSQVTAVGEQGSSWGTNESWAGKRVLVEYTDPNPFKEFHIGHLFTNVVGESLARLFIANGADTKKVNYQGDVGMHVAMTLWGVQQLGLGEKADISAGDLGQAYAYGATAYKAGEASTVAAIKAINKHVYERDDETINALYDKGREVSLAYFETIYETLGTQFDAYFFESEAGPKGRELVLQHDAIFTDSDGAKVFVGEEYGLHTRVFINSEGLPTYEAKELALAKMKEDALGAYDHSVVSTANEINEYFKVLLQAMSFVYPELAAKTEHIGHGMVRLSTGKMSSRTGDVIAANDFIAEITDAAATRIAATAQTGEVGQVDRALAEQIAIGAIKYTTLKGSILQDTVFDKEQALSFEGASGPYLQYTHARINSVLEKAAAVGVMSGTETVPEAPYAVERLLYRYPEVIADALVERAPHKVATFLTELASAFNTLYAQEKIADPSDQYAPYKATLAAAVGQTLKNGLWVLGIEAPDQM